ncbi:hypothetical protein F4861DRAFT_511869 [Xylaria intraflava]|nr:hypothetical protein F4861DRAFT_511869 [Xylaria intraflava]
MNVNMNMNQSVPSPSSGDSITGASRSIAFCTRVLARFTSILNPIISQVIIYSLIPTPHRARVLFVLATRFLLIWTAMSLALVVLRFVNKPWSHFAELYRKTFQVSALVFAWMYAPKWLATIIISVYLWAVYFRGIIPPPPSSTKSYKRTAARK